MNGNYYQGNRSHPQHISVGAVVLNGEGEVCCHHFVGDGLKGYWMDEGMMGCYLLMRATLNPEEAIEDTLERGLEEEFGVRARIMDYIGSIKSRFSQADVSVEKTTIYFLCELLSQDPNSRNKDDIEGNTNVEWHNIDFLITQMKKQAKEHNRTDIDESEVLEKVRPYTQRRSSAGNI